MTETRTWQHNLTYDLVLWFFNIIVNIFFRDVRPRGSHKIPKEGPVIFVAAPHANQFVDPVLLMRECKRRTSFLIAEKSMHQKGIGFFARLIHAIPVIRPQDLAKAGKGRIHLLDRKSDPLRITGVDTAFTSQLRPRDVIVLPKGIGKAEVVQVISDTELLIKREFKELKALELLTSNEGSRYKCLPHIEQEAVYKAVHDELYNGQCITIFPEGGSHDRAELLPLKAGVTVMAMGAMVKYPGLNVKIVPCGLNYFHAHRFRSRAVVEFGNPITISPELLDKFKEGGAQKREACSKLLETISEALKTVTVNAGSYETLMLIQAARRLYKPAYRKLHISQVVDLNRRFLIGYNLLKDEPKIIDLQERVLAYNQLLKYHGIKDHQVSKTDLGGRRSLLLLMKRVLLLVVLTLLVFPGTVLNLPVIIVARVISQKKAIAAVKGSTVKIAGRDILATWKILVALVLIPALYTLYSLIALILVLQTHLGVQIKMLVPIVTWVLLPFISYASLRFGEIGHDVLGSLQPLVMSLLDPDGAQTLRSNREKLSRDLTDAINEFGPKVFPDFDARAISQAAPISPNPSMTTSSRSTSSSSFSWTSRQPKLPKIASGLFQQATRMDWLDDKHIFNWGRVDESDMEESVFSLDKYSGIITGRSRSGSVSESDASGPSRPRSRTSSFGASSTLVDGFRLDTMTSLQDDQFGTRMRAKAHPIFKIEDVDEEQDDGKAHTPKKKLEDEGYAGDREDETVVQAESKKKI